MKTIECSVIVDDHHQATVQFPGDVPPGEHRVLIAIPDRGNGPAREWSENLASLDVGAWPENLSLRREDIYGDRGR